MIIKYRNLAFPIGTTTYVDTLTPVFNESQQRTANTRKIVGDGEFQGNAAQLAAFIKQFEQAFSIDGGDFTVTSPDGVLCCAIRSADTIAGLRVTLLSYPSGKSIEWVGRRTFHFELECEIAVSSTIDGTGGQPTTFSQTITFEGTGGPRTVIVETMNSSPLEFQVNARTKCRCTQEGRAASLRQRLTPPGPIFPAQEKVDLRRITPANSEGEISWLYVFESTSPF